MPEYVSTATQTVHIGQNVLLADAIPCTRGLALHRNGSGQVTLRGPQNNCCRARYKVSFTANIAVAAGGTVGPIGVALSVDGESMYSATAIVTPAAIGDFFNVNVEAYVDVPRCCCVSISVKNILPATGTAPGTAIDVANAALIITREA